MDDPLLHGQCNARSDRNEEGGLGSLMLQVTPDADFQNAQISPTVYENAC